MSIITIFKKPKKKLNRFFNKKENKWLKELSSYNPTIIISGKGEIKLLDLIKEYNLNIEKNFIYCNLHIKSKSDIIINHQYYYYIELSFDNNSIHKHINYYIVTNERSYKLLSSESRNQNIIDEYNYCYKDIYKDTINNLIKKFRDELDKKEKEL